MTPSPIGTVVRTSIHAAALGVFLCATASARPPVSSDSCATPELISGFGSFNFLLTAATDSPEFPSEPTCGPITRDVWFEWTAPSTDFVKVVTASVFQTRVYAGSGCPTAASSISCNSDVPFPVIAGATYVIRLGSAPGGTNPGGNFLIVYGTAAGDSCASPVILGGASFNAFTQAHFTGPEGQSQPACAGTGGNGILEDGWYRWTSTFTGNARFDCCNNQSSGNWKAAVYLDGSCPSSPPLACSDDACGTGGLQPELNFSAVVGQPYLFQVGRSPASTSTAPIFATFFVYSTDIPTNLPPNDECTSPTLIQGSGPFAYTLGTTTQITIPSCAASSPGDVWFRWVAPATGTATFDGCAAWFDQVVAVYNGLGCPMTAPPIACGDEGCGGMGLGPARFGFSVVCGSPYLLRVSHYGFLPHPPPWVSFTNTQGSFTLTVAGTPCSTFTPFCAGDQAASCPCANPGAAGRGCASSFSNQGGVIYGTGGASLANDTVSLRVEGVSPSFVTLLQGTSQAGGGAGISFGDGLLCAGGTLTRLVLRIANGGQLDYPQAGDVPLSVLGMVPAASTRVYQAWYRDALLAYCMPGTFNLTNGLEVSWTP